MAKQIIWSKKAKQDKKEILDYWLKRNKSYVYPRKLNNLLNEAINLTTQHSMPRRSTDVAEVYVKTVRDYKVFFKEDENSIYIITIWDTRQDSNNLKIILKK